MTDSKEFLTADEAAAFLGITKGSLHKHCFMHSFPYYRPGRRSYFKRSDLEAWITSNRIASDSELTDKAKSLSARR